MAKLIGTVTKRVVARSIALSRAATRAEAETGKEDRSPKAPAKVTGQRQTKGETVYGTASSGVEVRPALPVGRHRRAGETPHLEEHSPVPSARRCMLTVIEGGGQRTPGRGSRTFADRTRAREIAGEPARGYLKLVSG